MRVLLLLSVLALPVAAQEPEEFVLIPKEEVREILQELKRLRGELQKMDDRLIGCRA